MIVIAYKPGQLANRLFLFSKFLAYSYEHHVLVINPSFDDYAYYFEKTKSQFIPFSGDGKGYSLRPAIHLVFKLCYYLSRLLDRLKFNSSALSVTYLDWSEQYDLDGDRKLTTKGVHFVQGWGFNAPKLLSAHRLKVMEYFCPTKALQVQIDLFYEKLKHIDRLVGVHIRQGDYKSFEGGKYFYELHDYKSLMEGLATKYTRIHFLVCTNNKTITAKDFEKLNVFMASGHELIDLWLLAKCNYIMGPPSTYSQWASFYGNVPLYQIKNVNAEFGWDNFELKWIS